jgi:glutathione S-transferase
MATPVLWHFPISHFNEKVRWALDWKGVPHVRQVLGPTYLPRALLATGQPRLPILFLDGRAIADSTRIIAALEERYPEKPLFPADPDERRRALAFEDYLDEEVGHAVRTALIGPAFKRDPAAAIRVLTTGMPAGHERTILIASRVFRAFYRSRHDINDATIAASRGKIAAAHDRVEAELSPAGCLAGDRFTVAALTAAALLGVLVAPPELQYQPPPPLPAEFMEYRAELANRPAMQWVAEVYRRHRGRSAEVVA